MIISLNISCMEQDEAAIEEFLQRCVEGLSHMPVTADLSNSLGERFVIPVRRDV